MSGPGVYVPDVTEGITRVEDLPQPRIKLRSRNFSCRRCPFCLSFTHISLLTEVLTVINLAAIFNNTVHLFELSNELNENTITV